MTQTHAAAEALATRLIKGALPGELTGFGEQEIARAAAFVADTAAERCGEAPAIAIAPLPGSDRHRLRLAVVNDDMPFLVDSVAATIGAHGIAIERIIHPVVAVTCGPDGAPSAIGDGPGRWSMIYLEMDAVGKAVMRQSRRALGPRCAIR